jgi:hypothetical protein
MRRIPKIAIKLAMKIRAHSLSVGMAVVTGAGAGGEKLNEA